MLNLTLLDAENRNIVYLTGIGYAVNIANLALDDNQIAELPPEIGNLTKLEFLDLSGNQLTTLPTEIGNLSNLQILYLDGNQLTVLLAEIGNLTSLNHLFLTNNQLGVVPAEIGNLRNLNSLWLDENFLSVLPEEIWTLTELRTLAVDNNLLTSLPPQIGDLMKLENLFLDGNQLTSLPEELWTLTGLRGLSLGPNPLPTVLPTELWNLTNLVMLDLTGLQLDTLPPQIANLTELRELHLGDNQITDVSILADLATLQRLDLTGNQVVDISPLVSLTQLQELDLTQNSLNDPAYCQYLPLIRANNPGIDLQYDEAEDLPCDVEGRIYVDSNAPLGGVGSTWLSAFKYLRDALAAAEEGNQIWVVHGVYRPDQGSGAAPGDRTATFQLKNGVAVYGGFPIGGDWTSRDPETYETILSGDLAGDDQLVEDPADLPAEPTRGENSLHVVTGSGTDETAVLDGFIIEGGNANGAEVDDNGGGMNNEGGSPTVMNCVFRNNSADMGGAGMFNASSSPMITNCEFTNNCALEYGGGMNNGTDSNPHVTDCRFNYNKAVNGGGMLNSYNSSPIIEDCVFTYNDAEDAGGAIVNVYDSDPEVIHCIFERNSALQGAGMLNADNSNPALTNCTFRENTAREDAGAIDNGEASSPLIISCNFIGNQAADEGGAIQNDSSQPTFINCIFAGNKAMYAGAIKNETEGESPCVATFVNCTLTGNRATIGGAISTTQCSLTLTNCLIGDNDAGGNSDEIHLGDNSMPDISFCDIKDSGGSGNDWDASLGNDLGGNIDINPLFVDPGGWDDNGTPADTGDDIWIDGDYHLKSRAGHWDPVGQVWVKDSVNSPCIDAGDPADDVANEALPNGGIINMGVYGGTNEASLSAELVPVVYVKSDATGNNDGTTWGDAFTALQDALLHVELRSDTLIEIWVATGVYRPDTGSQQIPRHRGSTFHLVSNAEIYGGFDGTESRLDERNPQANTTFLSGDLNGDDGQGNYTDNSYHVVTASGTSNQAVLDGFVVSDGNADMPGMKGAGIICLSGGATIRNCTLQDNQATCAAAIDCRDSLLSLEDCTILSNSAPSGCHVAFSQSLVSIQGVVSVSDGQVNVFGGRFFGAGVLEVQSTAEMVINSSETCSVKNITNIWGAEMDPTTIYLSPYGNWPGQWWVPGVSLGNAVVLGEDTTWCIAPDFAAESAVLLWYGNELGYDMSFAGTAEARFDAGGELFIYGELYDITDAGTDLLYEGLLLWAHVDRFHIRENLVQTDQLDMLSSIEIMPLGGFLAVNDVGMRMSGVQLLNLSLGHCQQRGGPVINFQNDIETASTSELSLITAELPQAATVVSCGVIGAGDIDIQAGSELQLDGGMIRLRDTGNNQGRVTVDGKLVAMDGGFVKDSQIKVNSASFIQGSEAHYNSVGGDFFVSGAAYISGNAIEAEGDRYMNVDLTNPRQPTVGSNEIKVTIPPEETSEQGTLLELRAREDDCDTATNPQCRSGARQVTIGDRFAGAPAGNWVLDILHLEPHARLNLTNRRGFEFNAADGREVLYVKELILGPDSVLNTALQTLYYGTLILIAEDGSETIWAGGAPYPESFPNRSRIIDIPLLGFSLKVIDMDDLTQSPNNEFDIRVDYRLTDEADREVVGHGLPLPRGSILLLQHARDTGDGVMEMSTKDPDTVSAASIAAKGAFARAGDEDITIEFEYMFFEDSGDAEIVVYLSDHPTVGESLVEVARISPPAPGRPGAIGSSRYGLFSGVFPRGDLNFTRGTYVELELRGRDARCWIDNWDPAIRCGVVCGDYGGWYYGVSDIEDYLLLLSEFGLSWPVSVNKGCLDLINDGVINVNDLMAWNIEGMLNVCPTKSGDGLNDMSSNKAHVSTKSYTGPKIGIFEPLVVFGKPAANANGADLVPEDYLYSAHADGTVIESATVGTSGRLITDTNGQVYQIQGNGSLVHQSTGSIVFGPKQGVVYGSSTVSIGFIGGQTVPVLDAAFSPNDPDVVYVLPVLVTPSAGATPYKAAAKLALSGNLNDPNYFVEMIYGMDPNTDRTVTITSRSSGTVLLEPDVQHLSEIEVDSDGNLYILSAHGYTDNKWVLMYDERIGNPSETRISLSQFNIANPAVMLVSSNKEKLYLTSCANESADLAIEVYRFSIVRQGNDPNLALAEVITVNCPDPNVCGALPAFCAGGSYVATITAMAEDPDDGTVYATGFTAPKFDTNLTELPPEIKERGIYTTAILAKIPIDTAGPVDAREFKNTTGAPIVLPMSIAWTGGKLPKCSGADISGNGDVDMEDFAILVSQWFSTSPSLSADIAPERYYDETVDILDLATLATYWLHTDCK
ncbi:MAG: leucine-rich repeat domain-containing protein [Dehalococcoidales bacterium]